jgi:hypothetical protein
MRNKWKRGGIGRKWRRRRNKGEYGKKDDEIEDDDGENEDVNRMWETSEGRRKTKWYGNKINKRLTKMLRFSSN